MSNSRYTASRDGRAIDNSLQQHEAATSKSIAQHLCHQLTESITSLESQARELRFANACKRDANLRRRLSQLNASLSAVEQRAQELVDLVNTETDALRRVQAQHQLAQEHHQRLLKLQDHVRQHNNASPPLPTMENLNLGSSFQNEEGHLPQQSPLVDTAFQRHQPKQTLQRVDSNEEQNSSMDDDSEENSFRIGSSASHVLLSSTAKKKKLASTSSVTDARRIPMKQIERRLLEEPISMEELEEIPRATRGRISLYVLNDALQDIAAHCKSKVKRNKKKTKPAFVLNNASSFSAAATNNKDVFTVSEQELRQSCSFFRMGEGTARSILLILKTLGRLHQVPAKHGDVTYIVG